MISNKANKMQFCGVQLKAKEVKLDHLRMLFQYYEKFIGSLDRLLSG